MVPSADLGLQVEVSLRLVVACLRGAAIGFEREVHTHPAGMRTRLLVSRGAADVQCPVDLLLRLPGGAHRLAAGRPPSGLAKQAIVSLQSAIPGIEILESELPAE